MMSEHGGWRVETNEVDHWRSIFGKFGARFTNGQ